MVEKLLGIAKEVNLTHCGGFVVAGFVLFFLLYETVTRCNQSKMIDGLTFAFKHFSLSPPWRNSWEYSHFPSDHLK